MKKWQKPIHAYKPTKNPGPSRADLRAMLKEAVEATTVIPADDGYKDPPLDEYVANAGYDSEAGTEPIIQHQPTVSRS